jgi:methionyl-tRNA synthetase
VIGKDITRFHCVIWPAMLQAAGEPLPGGVWAHGFVSYGGDRFAKSAGVRLDLQEAIARHGADALRYFLLREVGFEGDGEFTWERFDEVYTSELADGIGNLASRSLAMLEKYRGGRVPDVAPDPEFEGSWVEVWKSYRLSMEGNDLRAGAHAIVGLVNQANSYIVRTAPWTLAKQGKDAALDKVLTALACCLYRLAVMTSPFMPGKAAELWQALGQEGEIGAAAFAAEQPGLAGALVRKPGGLFPKPQPSNS